MSEKSLQSILRAGSYQSKLQDPEWKSFTRIIRNERSNACEICKRIGIELNVHHPFYEPDREPWQYAKDEVILLCRHCHSQMHDQLKKFRKYVFGKFTPATFRVVNGALAVALDHYDPLVFAHALAKFVSTPSMVQRYADAWERDANQKTEEQKQYERFKRSMTGDITARATIPGDDK